MTDWGSNMVSAGTELASKLTNFLTSVQCLQHLLNNALKDFAKEPSLGTLSSPRRWCSSSPATQPQKPSMTVRRRS